MIYLKVFFNEPREIKPPPVFFGGKAQDYLYTDNAGRFARAAIQKIMGFQAPPEPETVSIFRKGGRGEAEYIPVPAESSLHKAEDYLVFFQPAGFFDQLSAGLSAATIGFLIGGPVAAAVGFGIGFGARAIADNLVDQQDARAASARDLADRRAKHVADLKNVQAINPVGSRTLESAAMDYVAFSNKVNPGSVVPESFGKIQIKPKALTPFFLYADEESDVRRYSGEKTGLYYFIFYSLGEGDMNTENIRFSENSASNWRREGNVRSRVYNKGQTIVLRDPSRRTTGLPDGPTPSSRHKLLERFEGLPAKIQGFLSLETALQVRRLTERLEPPDYPRFRDPPASPNPTTDTTADGDEIFSAAYIRALRAWRDDTEDYNDDVRNLNETYEAEVKKFEDNKTESTAEHQNFIAAAQNTTIVISRKIPDYTSEPASLTPNTTRNPAVIAAYILQNAIDRSKAPVDLADVVDLPAFRVWKTFCTDKGLNFDASFDTDYTTFQALQQIFYIGMAEIDSSFGKIRPIIKKTRATLAQIFHSRNLSNLTYSKIGQKAPDKISGSFINAAKQYKPDEAHVYTSGRPAAATLQENSTDITPAALPASFGAGAIGYSQTGPKAGSLSTDKNDDFLAVWTSGGKALVAAKHTAAQFLKLWHAGTAYNLKRTKNNAPADGRFGNIQFDEYEASDAAESLVLNRGAGSYFRASLLGMQASGAGALLQLSFGYLRSSGTRVARDVFKGAQFPYSSSDSAANLLHGNTSSHDSIIGSAGPYWLGPHGVYRANAEGIVDNRKGQAFCNWYLASAAGAQKVTANFSGFDPRAVSAGASKIFVLFDNRDRKQTAAAESFKIGIFDLSTGGLTSVLTLTETIIGQILGAANQDLDLGLVVVSNVITPPSRLIGNGRTKYDLIPGRRVGLGVGFFADIGYLIFNSWQTVSDTLGHTSSLMVVSYGIQTFIPSSPLPADMAGFVKNSDKSGSQNSALYSYSGTWSRVEINGVEHALGAREFYRNTTNDALGTSYRSSSGGPRPTNTRPLYRQEFRRFNAGQNLRFKDASGKWYPAPSATLTGTKRPFPARGLAANGENISLCIGGLLNAKTIKDGLITIDTAGNYILDNSAVGVSGKIAVAGGNAYYCPFVPAEGDNPAYYSSQIFRAPITEKEAAVPVFSWTEAGQTAFGVRIEKAAGVFLMFGLKLKTAATARDEHYVNMFGVTSQTQALKYLNLQKRLFENINESYVFETDIQALAARRGDLVGLNHYEISKTQFTARITGFTKDAGGKITGIQIDQGSVPSLDPSKNYGCQVLEETGANPDFSVSAIADLSAESDKQNIQIGDEDLTTRAGDTIRVRPKRLKTLRLSAPQAAAGFLPKEGDYVVFGEETLKFKKCLVDLIAFDKNLRARVSLVPYIESVFSQI